MEVFTFGVFSIRDFNLRNLKCNGNAATVNFDQFNNNNTINLLDFIRFY